MPDEKFRLPSSSYDELVKIIKAYGQTKGPASPSEVASFVGIHETVVSANNRFLIGAGIVEGGNKKAVTHVGDSLARALDHNIVDQIASSWREVIEQTDFLSRLVTAVRIRGGMEPASLQSHVAYTAGQPNRGKVKTGAATVVDILKVAEVLREDDGKLFALDRVEPSERDEGEVAGVRKAPEPQAVAGFREAPEPQARRAAPPPPWAAHPHGVSIQIRVSVACSVDELPALASNLAQLMKTLPNEITLAAETDAE